MLTKEAKEAASQMFKPFNSMATDSTTDSESEVERTERYPNFGSPRSGSRRFNQQIRATGARLPSKRRAGKKLLLDEGEDGEVLLSETVGFEGFDEPKEDPTKVAMGGVVLDPPLLDGTHGSSRYEQYQLRRQINKTTSPSGSRDLNLSTMGLFALLPGELRNRIYRLILVDLEGPHMIVMQPGTCSLGRCTHTKLRTAAPGLLSTCRQIRHEAAPIFCSENRAFKFDAQTVRDRCTANWLRTLGAYGGSIPRIVLEVMVWESVTPNSLEKVGRAYEIRVGCPASRPERRFVLEFDAQIMAKDEVGCKRLLEHVEKLSEQVGQKRDEELLLQFVWSDWMAELVYRCKK